MGYTLITGASSGIGEEFARQFAAKGHSLILVARSEGKLNELAKELSAKHSVHVQVIKQDLSELDSANKVFEKCRQANWQVRGLVNNAGLGQIGEFEEEDPLKMEKVIILNTITLTKLVYLFLPQLKENGFLMNVASQVAFNPSPQMAVYGATKAYVLNFTEALREEQKESKIRITALCPGPTYTDFFRKADASANDIQFKFRTPQDVVSQGINALEKDKAFHIVGWENSLFVFFSKFIPRTLLTKMAANLVKK